MCLLTVYTNTSPASTQVCDLEGKVCDLEGKVCDLEGKVCDLEGKVCELEGKVCDLEGKVCDQGVCCYLTMANVPVGVQGDSTF